MRERFGIRDLVMVLGLAAVIGLQVGVLLQKNHDAAVVVAEENRTRDQVEALDRNLSQTNQTLKELAGVLRQAGGNGNAGGGVKINTDVAKTLTNIENIDTRPVGGELVWGFDGTEPSSINPITGRDMYSRYISRENRFFEFLINRNYLTTEWEGVLAESWKVSEDGREIIFKLKPQARFSDGKPVTADDVVFSMQLALNPLTDCPNLRSYLDKLEKDRPVEALDAHTVRFRFAEKYFLSLEAAGATIPVLPKHVYASYVTGDLENFGFNKITGKLPTDPLIGSGPYKLQEWKKGEELILVRNENYWGRKPALDRVRFRMYANGQALLQAMRKREVDFYLNPQADNFDECSRDPKFTRDFFTEKWDSPDSGFRYVGYNMRLPLFADKRVRQALTHVLDRETMLRELDFGLGKVATGYFWSASKQADPTIKPWPYDIERAKELLAEAGWKPGPNGILVKDGKEFKFKFQVSAGRPYYVQLGRRFKDACAKVGIDVQIEFFEWAVYSDKLTKREFEVVCLGWGGGGVEGDPYQIWHSSQAENRGSNYVGFVNAEADRCIEEARKELDAGKRNELFHKFHRILHEEQPYTFLTQRFSCAFIDRKFEIKVGKLGVEPLQWFIPDPEKRRPKQG